MKFQEVLKSASNNPYIIAEINTSHRGDLNVAKETIVAAKEAGANAVKFQSWSPRSLFTETYLEERSLERRFFEKFSLSEDSLAELIDFSVSHGIDASSTAYSVSEIDFLNSSSHTPFIKLASMDLTNFHLVGHALRTGKPVIVSTGLSSNTEVIEALARVSDDIDSNLVIFHCTSLYPTPLRDSAIGNIKWLQALFPGIAIGYSDHTQGSTAAVMAASLGARVFEKHFSLDTTKPGFDNHMAADFENLSRYVEDIRDSVRSVETYDRELSNEELSQARTMRRSAFAAREIAQGSEVRIEDLIFARPGTGINHFGAEKFIGKVTRRRVEKDEMITAGMFQDGEE